jgi:hypothetical protein
VTVQRHASGNGRLDEARRSRLEALPKWTWDAREGAWEEGFSHLKRFVERDGHARVPHQWRERDFRLGQWVAVQRRNFSLGRIADSRRHRLEALPGWAWNAREGRWEDAFAKLRRFVRREGHARVSQDWREDGYPLGKWAMLQRLAFKKGSLDETRRKRLEAVPGWTWVLRDATWEDSYECLVRFASREGHTRVPAEHKESGLRLGTWVNTQRARRRRGTLDGSQIARLEVLPGWNWSLLEADWEEGFAATQAFVARNGHSRVPSDLRTDDGFKLGAWVHRQRETKNRGSLSDERVRRLEALPGWVWRPFEAAWEEGYSALEQFVGRNGHSRVPSDFREHNGFKLGAWVARQRQAKKRGSLSDERTGRLEALPGWVWRAR